jgi:hypothetical protein
VIVKMDTLGEILQAVVALSLVIVDAIMHLKGINAPGFDEAIPVIVTVYVGGKVIQSVQSANGKTNGASAPHAARSTDVAPAPISSDATPLAAADTAAAGVASIPGEPDPGTEPSSPAPAVAPVADEPAAPMTAQ